MSDKELNLEELDQAVGGICHPANLGVMNNLNALQIDATEALRPVIASNMEQMAREAASEKDTLPKSFNQKTGIR